MGLVTNFKECSVTISGFYTWRYGSDGTESTVEESMSGPVERPRQALRLLDPPAASLRKTGVTVDGGILKAGILTSSSEITPAR